MHLDYSNMRYMPSIFALGFGIEKVPTCSDDFEQHYTSLCIKIFLLKWVVNIVLVY